MQTLSDPPAARELAQFLDPDGMANSFRLEQSGEETTAHPTGRFGPVYIWFLRFVCLLIIVGIGAGAAEWWQNAHPVLGIVVFFAMLEMLLVTHSYMVRLLRFMDTFYLVHGPFARWNAAAGTIELPRLGVALRRDQIMGMVCLTGPEWCGGWVRAGARCRMSEGLPERALSGEDNWVQVNELSVIARAEGGTLARHPLITVENPWRFREFATRFAADFGLPLQVIMLNRTTRRELRLAGWTHAGEFADGDRPRKVAAGRVAMSDGNFPGFGRVTLCRPSGDAVFPAGSQREEGASPS